MGFIAGGLRPSAGVAQMHHVHQQPSARSEAVMSAFAAKHTNAPLQTLGGLLQTTETDPLNRNGKIVATLGP